MPMNEFKLERGILLCSRGDAITAAALLLTWELFSPRAEFSAEVAARFSEGIMLEVADEDALAGVFAEAGLIAENGAEEAEGAAAGVFGAGTANDDDDDEAAAVILRGVVNGAATAAALLNEADRLVLPFKPLAEGSPVDDDALGVPLPLASVAARLSMGGLAGDEEISVIIEVSDFFTGA